MIITKKNKKVHAILFIVTFTFITCINAQSEAPEWVTKLPKKSGYLYGAGTGKSSDISMAGKKARMNALSDLSYYYENKLETLSKTCDTIIGPNNKVSEVITSISTKTNATFIGIEEVDKKVEQDYNGSVVYLLVRLDVREDLDKIEDQIKKEKKLKKSGKARLLEELDKL